VDCEPLMDSLPDQALDAVQDVALADDQVNMELPPLVTVLGLALMVTVGAGEVTVTVADCAALPPVPVQVSVYVAFAVSAPVESEPLVPLAPDQAPAAVQEVALVVDQFKVEPLPLTMELGVAEMLTVGAGAGWVTETVAD
jgi:hypothetical protein